MILRGGSAIVALAALVIQVQFYRSLGEFESGQVEKVVRMTRSYPQMGLYVTMAVTALAILLFLLRFFEEKTERPDSQSHTESDDAKNSEPRLSRLAIFGLILIAIGTPIALFDLCAVVDVVVVPTALGQPIATQGPIHTFGHEIRDSIVFSLAALLVAAILSGFAIDQIKRSDGKLYGLRLAVADMLVFPLLMLAALVAVPIGMVLVARHAGIASPGIGAVIGLVVCFFVGRAVWRALVGHSSAPQGWQDGPKMR